MTEADLSALRAAIERCDDKELRDAALIVLERYAGQPEGSEWFVPHVMDMYKE